MYVIKLMMWLFLIRSSLINTTLQSRLIDMAADFLTQLSWPSKWKISMEIIVELQNKIHFTSISMFCWNYFLEFSGRTHSQFQQNLKIQCHRDFQTLPPFQCCRIVWHQHKNSIWNSCNPEVQSEAISWLLQCIEWLSKAVSGSISIESENPGYNNCSYLIVMNDLVNSSKKQKSFQKKSSQN